MDMSTLIKTEHDNWKKRMIVETCGTYVLMNIGMGFVVIAGAFCGVMNTEFDLYYYNMVGVFLYIGIIGMDKSNRRKFYNIYGKMVEKLIYLRNIYICRLTLKS